MVREEYQEGASVSGTERQKTERKKLKSTRLQTASSDVRKIQRREICDDKPRQTTVITTGRENKRLVIKHRAESRETEKQEKLREEEMKRRSSSRSFQRLCELQYLFTETFSLT